jgi:hypothetical protein
MARRAAIFRNGRNQAVRLPQDLKLPFDIDFIANACLAGISLSTPHA